MPNFQYDQREANRLSLGTSGDSSWTPDAKAFETLLRAETNPRVLLQFAEARFLVPHRTGSED